jgi:hypothetical protein
MGPNNKERSRRDYVKYRLRVLKELEISPPPDDLIEKMKDEKQMSEIQVDAIFLDCIRKAE